jgi:hypothetical protein
MAFTPAWRNFKRMQDITVAAACLIYAGAVVHAFGRLPGGTVTAFTWTLVWPAAFLGFSLAIPLLAPPFRRGLAKYVWMSFKAGFGQTPGSVLGSVALSMGAGYLIYRAVESAARTGQLGVNLFSCYAAGIGILVAQAILVRALEALPDVRREIEE